jgi:hypothetical protein
VWCLLTLVVFQIPLAIWIEPRTELRDPEYGLKLRELQTLLANEPGRPLFLALGSSRTLNGFRPERLEGMCASDGRAPVFFNFGLTAHSALHQLACFNRLINAGIRPTWMVIEVTPSFLPIEVSASTMVSFKVQEWSDLKVLERYEAWRPLLYVKWLEPRVMPWFSHRLALIHRYLPRWLPSTCKQYEVLGRVTDQGWLPLPELKTEKERKERLAAAEKDHKSVLQQFVVSKLSADALHELLSRCRQMGIPTALVLTPEGSLFRSWYAADANRILDEYLGRVRDEFGVPIIDAREWIADEHFWDGHHLLPEGAAEYTDRLARELANELLRNRN